ncbi:F-box/FBD/LRR-repeat protein At4g26340-like isoform X1 [Prosopis cineraria]|uniref:F-box/FBD/LRR-repeat protein At4g26340-like isoform X1 n=1 Tax=Prosopis cineraria TaxID=364024 RepID=UPI0024101EBB|nr:F-box/FBD/LRR-repeat protein At4g26340-like isoform X1 [Prosopis cineraria]
MSDEISKLSDELLEHILSFLPTKQAIAASLVCKRWKTLWRSLSTLHLDDSIYQNYISFVKFVYGVFICGDFRSIKKFHLVCQSCDSYPNQIKIWAAHAALNLKVEQLELIFPFSNYSLLSGVFVCSTIKELKLEGLLVDSLSCVNLPSLKIMHLQRAKFHDFKLVAMLLSGCPLLESLSLSFKCRGMPANVAAAVDVADLKHLASATFGPFMMNLKAFSNVKFLSLCETFWIPSQDHMPTYDNLTRLEFSCYAKDWGEIVKCLKNCPKLQNLVIRKALAGSPNNHHEEVESLMEPVFEVPQCISSHLKTFYLAEYEDFNSQFQMVRFIWREAKVLRTITLSSSVGKKKRKMMRRQMLERLSRCCMGRVNCNLLFD